jgi:hypothetical protein
MNRAAQDRDVAVPASSSFVSEEFGEQIEAEQPEQLLPDGRTGRGKQNEQGAVLSSAR